MKRVEIIRKDLAPGQLKVFAVLIVLATNYKLLTFTFHEVNPLVFIVGIIVAFAILTAKDILVVDSENKCIREGFKILGLKYADKSPYSNIEKIYINKVNTGQTFRQMTRTIDIHHEDYKAFLKTSNGDKYWIAINSDKDKLIKRLKEYNKYINTTIIDNTLSEPVVVD